MQRLLQPDKNKQPADRNVLHLKKMLTVPPQRLHAYQTILND